MTVTDPGNVYDRRPSYRYISAPKEFPQMKQLRAIDWKADAPPGTSIRFQMRSASTSAALAKATWEGPTGAASDFTTPASNAVPLHGSWVQFQVMMDNPGGGLPVVRAVTLDFQ